MLRLCRRDLASSALPTGVLGARGEVLLRQLFSGGQAAEASAASEESDTPAESQGADRSGSTQQPALPHKRVALPHKVSQLECRSYQEYLQQRWRFRTSTDSLEMDKRQLYRLANMLEYQTIQGLKMADLLQTIVTETVQAKEQQRQACADPAAIEAMEASIGKVIGALVWFKRAQRPTFEALAQFRDNRTQRIKKAEAARREGLMHRAGEGAQEAPAEKEAGEEALKAK